MKIYLATWPMKRDPRSFQSLKRQKKKDILVSYYFLTGTWVKEPDIHLYENVLASICPERNKENENIPRINRAQ